MQDSSVKSLRIPLPAFRDIVCWVAELNAELARVMHPPRMRVEPTYRHVDKQTQRRDGKSTNYFNIYIFFNLNTYLFPQTECYYYEG